MKKLLAILAVVAFVGGFAAPAVAADWAFYGQARMGTFWNSSDLGDFTNAAGDDSDDDFLTYLHSNARIGANVKADNIAGRFEYGTSGGNANIRLLYGVWDFGSGKLLAGQDYTPIALLWSNQVWATDNGMLGEGEAYGSRVGQLKLMFGDFQIAAIAPSTSTLGIVAAEVDTYVPKIEARYYTKMDAFEIAIFGGFQSFDIDRPTDDITVTSWMAGAGMGYNFGPAWVKGAVSFYQNAGNAGWSSVKSTAVFDGVDDTVDVDSWMGEFLVGFKATDMVSFEAGFGYQDADSDAAGADNDDMWQAYLQAVLDVAPGVDIIPEIGYRDYMDDAAGFDEGSLFYLGARWRIRF
jgi:hypothetical protein